MLKKSLVAIFLIITSFAAVAQETEKKEPAKTETIKGNHRLSMVIGHSHLSEGIMENGKKGWKILPSWGFDYELA